MSDGNGGGGNAPTAPTAIERALQLIRQSDGGLTAEELRADEVLSQAGSSTCSTIPTHLKKKGLIESAGYKRDGFTVWRAVANPVPPAPKEPEEPTDAATRRANEIIEALRDVEVRAEVKEILADRRDLRSALAALTAAERELEAARLDAERREAAAERERLRTIEDNRKSMSTSIKTWETLTEEVTAAWKMIATYTRISDDLPAPHASFERILGRELEELRKQLDWLEDRLYPNRNHAGPIRAGTIIDVG